MARRSHVIGMKLQVSWAEALLKRRWTIRQLAQEASLPYEALRRVISDGAGIGLAKMERVCRILEIDPAEFVFGKPIALSNQSIVQERFCANDDCPGARLWNIGTDILVEPYSFQGIEGEACPICRETTKTGCCGVPYTRNPHQRCPKCDSSWVEVSDLHLQPNGKPWESVADLEFYLDARNQSRKRFVEQFHPTRAKWK